jgi:phage-related protein
LADAATFLSDELVTTAAAKVQADVKTAVIAKEVEAVRATLGAAASEEAIAAAVTRAEAIAAAKVDTSFSVIETAGVFDSVKAMNAEVQSAIEQHRYRCWRRLYGCYWYIFCN